MPDLSFTPRPNLNNQITPQLWGRIKLSNFMDISEEEFRQQISQIENHPLFKRLNSPLNPQTKIISYQRFPNTDINRNFCQLNEDITTGSKSPDLDPLLEKRKEILPYIKKMGIDNFKKYFLYSENEHTDQEIASACKITPDKVKSIQEVMDELYILDLTHPTPAVTASNSKTTPGVKIASIEKSEDSSNGQPEFKIGYFSPHYAKGRYSVNYKMLFQLKSKNEFSKSEFKEIERIVKQIELINTRRTMLHSIIKKILETQTDYFKTGDDNRLKPLTQQMLAKFLSVHRSTVNRVVNRKYIETPWGEEKYLKFFLINRKHFVKRILAQITKDSATDLADEVIKNMLKEKYNISLARRTICSYRNELDKKVS
jgi:hypothetical protein